MAALLPPKPESVPLNIIGAFGEASKGLTQSVHLTGQGTLLLVTSLGFLLPTLSCWQLKRVWHTWLFGIMTIICFCHHACRSTATKGLDLGAEESCHPNISMLLDHAYQIWAYYCFLQMAFLVFGPEDPRLHWIDKLGDKSFVYCSPQNEVPNDVVINARIVPFVALFASHCFNSSLAASDMQWRSLLLMEILLLYGTISFWAYRHERAPEVLLRLKYWQRLLHHGFIPALMLFWIFCITGFADYKALHSAWHIAIISFAVSIQRTVLPEPGGSNCSPMVDTSAMNPGVSHILLGSVALAVLPTAIIGASFDWCPSGDWQWPTIGMASACQPGGYFVAIVALPAYTAGAAVVWLIDSTVSAQSATAASEKPWELLKPGIILGLDPHQRLLGKKLASLNGYLAVGSGVLSALITTSSFYGTVHDFLGHLFGLMSLGCLVVAMSLTVLSSEPGAREHRFRRNFTLGICVPTVAFYALLYLLDNFFPNHGGVPRATFAITEYATIALVSIWPIIWASELQQEGQRRAKSSFAWPTTGWRFQDL